MGGMVQYTVEHVSRPYSRDIPWEDAHRSEGLTVHQAIKIYNETWVDCHPQPNAWCGHVRIVGDDDWIYAIDGPYPGSRATLVKRFHLDDIR